MRKAHLINGFLEDIRDKKSSIPETTQPAKIQTRDPNTGDFRVDTGFGSTQGTAIFGVSNPQGKIVELDGDWIDGNQRK